MVDPTFTIAAIPQRPPSRPAVAAVPGSTAVPAWAIPATAAVCGASALISLIAVVTRGPWIDEFWTLFAIDPHLSLTAAFKLRWLTDVHPPLFYFLTRMSAGVLGNSIEVLRLQNVIPMAGLVAFFVMARLVWRVNDRFLMLYAILTFTSYFATGYCAELRSYYLQFVCAVGFYGSAYFLLSAGSAAAPLAWLTALATFGATCLLLVNLHFVTALLTSISLVGLALVAGWLRHRRLGVLICIVGAVAATPLMADLYLQAANLVGRSGGQFWIETGLTGAVSIIAGSVVKGLGANLVACGVACYRMAIGVVPGVCSSNRERVDLVVGSALVGLAALSIVLLLAINFFTPVVVDRYLLLCSAALMCGIAILAQDAVFSLRYGYLLVVANAVLFLAIAGGKLIGEQRWNATAAIIRSQVARCPTASVVAIPFAYANTLPNEPKVFALGYEYLAERYGYHNAMETAGSARAHDQNRRCPMLVWIEHVPWTLRSHQELSTTIKDAVGQALGRADLSRLAMMSTKTGVVVVIPPNQGNQP